MVTLKSRITVPSDVLFRDVGSEAVILSMGTGKYYGLDEVGTRMWALLAEHRCLEPVYQALLTEYDVEAGRLEQDLLHLTNELVDCGLLLLDAS
ncbi:MAG: PqqD family protein [Anaerolineae bacterium]|nr:PqqD family protein [Anaerolineae bacterium]